MNSARARVLVCVCVCVCVCVFCVRVCFAWQTEREGVRARAQTHTHIHSAFRTCRGIGDVNVSGGVDADAVREVEARQKVIVVFIIAI